MEKSFLKFFHLIFVLFSLYLLGDAFYRWDAVKYYASFYEFLPGIALTLVLWSIIAFFVTILIWSVFRMLESILNRANSKLYIENFLVFTGCLVFVGAVFWIGKRQAFPLLQTSFQMKVIVLLVAAGVSIVTAWLLRNISGQWLNIILERIRPLVYLFGILVVCSVPFVIYHTFSFSAFNDPQVIQQPDTLSSKDINAPNIILVTFDALSTRDMSLYHYGRTTTPFISRWAKSATVFTNLKAASNFTAPATASMMTGKRVWTHQRYHSHGSRPIKSNTENIPLLLKNKGYYNMAFIQNPIASVHELGMSDSFHFAPPADKFRRPVSLLGIMQRFLQQVFGDKIMLCDWILRRDFIFYKAIPGIFKDSKTTEFPADNVFNSFLSIVDSNNLPEPFFAWIHLFPPHAHYLPPEPFMGMFDSSEKYRTYESQDPLMSLIQREQPENDVYRTRYDEYIRYCDKQFEFFINKLGEKRILENSVVLLSSDHGEIFDHNYITHGNSLYEAETDIPFVISIPKQNKGRVVHNPVAQIDIPATILDLADIPIPSWVEGRSLVPLIKGDRFQDRPVFSINLQLNPSRGHKITKGMFAVWEGDYKLIHYLGKNNSMLFNLKQDPHELHNLVERERDLGQYLLDLLLYNIKEANENLSG